MSPKTLFITGGSGYIGTQVIRKAISRGYIVHALARSDSSATKITSLGATPVLGSLSDIDLLVSQARNVDIFMSIAFDMDFTDQKMDMQNGLKADTAIINAVTEVMKPGSVFTITTGALAAAQDPDGGEVDETGPLASGVFGLRGANEALALSKAKNGIIVNVIRPAAFVYGREGSGVAMFMKPAAQNGMATYVDKGSALVSSVHVDDCAEVFLLAAEKRETGIYNAASDTSVSFKQLAEAIGSVLEVPVVSITRETAIKAVGEGLANFLSSPSRTSGRKAMEKLGWKPEGLPILEEITTGSYVDLVKKLKA